MNIFYRIIVCMFILGWTLPGNAQVKENRFTIEDFSLTYSFRSNGVYGIRSLNDGEHYTVIEDNGRKLVMYSYKTGKPVETLLDLTKPEYQAVRAIQGYEFSSDESRLLICTNVRPIYRRSFTAEYYVYDFKNRELKPLSQGGPQRLATFSPQGTKVAFMRDNNLFIADLRFGSEIQITFDGKYNEIINGAPDWVYEEEFAFNRAFEWAPDGSALAYIKFDESKVREYEMNMFRGLAPSYENNAVYPSNYVYKYPKAGETNSTVSVHVYDIKDRITTPMNIGEETDIYIPRIQWSRDPKRLAIMKLNRFQNKLEILLANARVGTTSLLYREENKYYIAEYNFDNLFFTEDGKYFIMSSEKSGYSHLYLYTMGGKEVQALTSGNYDVVNFYGYDSQKGICYYASHEVSPIEKYVYSINLKGKKKLLTPEKGWNEAEFSHSFKYYINVVSNAGMPPVTTLYGANGKAVRVLEDNQALKDKLANYNVAKREFIQIPAADGKTMLNAWIMKPTNFEEGKEYPLLITQYSGPNSQQVLDQYGFDWEQYLATKGIISVCVDGRGTGARGEAFRKCTYLRMGELESRDQVEAAQALGKLPYIDKDRIAIWGWSFGGYNTLMSMSVGNGTFKAGIAVAPPTDWKYYDTVYTERFMRTPKENYEGYAATSPIRKAKDLQGKLLLIHGTADDNVHFQQTMDYAEALVQAGKQFEMQVYKDRNHGIYGGNTRFHLYTRMSNFLFDNL